MLIFAALQDIFYRIILNKKHFEKILLFTSNTTLSLVYFFGLFWENGKSSKKWSSFLQISNGSSLMNFHFFNFENLLIFCSKRAFYWYKSIIYFNLCFPVISCFVRYLGNGVVSIYFILCRWFFCSMSRYEIEVQV